MDARLPPKDEGRRTRGRGVSRAAPGWREGCEVGGWDWVGVGGEGVEGGGMGGAVARVSGGRTKEAL